MVKRNALALPLLVLLLLMGCGASEPSNQEVAASTEASADVTSAPVADGSSPIDSMLGIPVMDEGAFNDFLIEVIGEGERRTAECMLAAGFEYTPETPRVNGPSARENTHTREYVERNGFGILAAFEAATFSDETPLPPNVQYTASLSDGERDAYQMALFGEPVADEEFDDNDGFPSVGSGCKALAIEELSAVFAVMDEFGPAADDVFDQLEADIRILELSELWSTCMADSGYEVSDREEVRETLIWERFELLLNRDDIYVESGVDLEPLDTSGTWSGFLSGDTFGPHPPPTVEGQALFDEFGAFEREVALASFDCYEPLREAEREVQLEYERVLVDRIGGEIGERLDDD